MIALVTGASGFIGSQLVDTLRAQGVEVRLVTRPLPADTAFRRHPCWDGVTHVFHLAARTRAPDARRFHDANVTFTARLLEAARSQPVAPHLVFVSSLAAAGAAAGPTAPRTEADPVTPVGHYGASKREAELLVERAGIPYTIVRPPAVYGPRDRDFLTVFRQVQRPVHWRATPGWHAFTLLHVHDVVAALLTVARTPDAHDRIYGLGGDQCTWDGFYEAVRHAVHATGSRVHARVAPASVPLEVPGMLMSLAASLGGWWGQLTGHVPLANPDKLALGRVPWWLSSGARLEADTGWRCTVSLADGLRATASWYRANGWL